MILVSGGDVVTDVPLSVYKFSVVDALNAIVRVFRVYIEREIREFLTVALFFFV